MKRVTIDIDEKYAGIINVTAVGVCAEQPFEVHTYVSTASFNLAKGAHIIIDENGEQEQRSEGE